MKNFFVSLDIICGLSLKSLPISSMRREGEKIKISKSDEIEKQ
jgi:hypothetical protein